MAFFGKTIFHIKGLNQERILNELSKNIQLFSIDRKSKSESTFSCHFLKKKYAKKFLLGKGIEIVSTNDIGIYPRSLSIFSCYGLIVAIVLFFCFYIFQYQYILQYKIDGVENLSTMDVVDFLKSSVSKKKSELDTKIIEDQLMEKFDEISLVSCIIKGQTLVVNIKEKLRPDSIYGDFLPIFSDKNAKITQISLISGTPKVRVGDFVKIGDVLVEPYTIDTSGNVMQVEAKAMISAEVYNQGFSEHFDSRIETYRTGATCESSQVKFYGISIYTNDTTMNFEKYEKEEVEKKISKNNILPLILEKTIYYEVKERLVESCFEDVKDEFVEKARTKSLSKCANYDKIKEEYYTIKHMSGVTIVSYCVVTEEEIGVYNDC